MIFTLVNFTLTIIAALSIFIILKNYKSNENFNIYFVILLLNLFVWRFIYSLHNFDIIKIIKEIKFNALGLLVFPVFYFFFTLFLKQFSTLKERVIHFSVIVLNIILFLSDTLNDKNKSLMLLIITFVYFMLLIKLFIKKYSTISKSRRWFLNLMTTLSIIMGVTVNMSFNSNSTNSFEVMKTFFNYSSFIWFATLLYVFLKPELLYGTNNLIDIINNINIDKFKAWKYTFKGTLNKQEQTISKKVDPSIKKIITRIEKFSSNYYNKGKVELSFDILNQELNIPKSHLDYIFKHYCIYTKGDFLNYCKINYSISLIENNYLTNKTIETLSADCFFNSKTTFYNNFKKFTGFKPLELYKQ